AIDPCSGTCGGLTSCGGGGGAHANDDLVFVATHAMMCPSPNPEATHSRVIAYYASNINLTPKWTYNGTGTAKMDFASDGGALNYADNTLYIGTNLSGTVTGQNSLWALDTATNLAGGHLKWSVNAGSIGNRPMLNPNTSAVYVASGGGSL